MMTLHDMSKAHANRSVKNAICQHQNYLKKGVSIIFFVSLEDSSKQRCKVLL